jgi:hypothetical protein
MFQNRPARRIRTVSQSHGIENSNLRAALPFGSSAQIKPIRNNGMFKAIVVSEMSHAFISMKMMKVKPKHMSTKLMSLSLTECLETVGSMNSMKQGFLAAFSGGFHEPSI